MEQPKMKMETRPISELGVMVLNNAKREFVQKLDELAVAIAKNDGVNLQEGWRQHPDGGVWYRHVQDDSPDIGADGVAANAEVPEPETLPEIVGKGKPKPKRKRVRGRAALALVEKGAQAG